MPFQPFREEQLDAFYQRHDISLAGKEVISAALAEPSRNTQGSTKNIKSDIPCPKMYGNAQSESWTTENAFIQQAIFDNDVLAYATQPCRLQLSYRGRNGRKVRTPYTADCLRLSWAHGVILEEWKPASARDTLIEDFPGKYQRRSNGTYTSEPVLDVIRPWGWKFVVRFSDEIPEMVQRNRRALYPYLARDSHKHYERDLNAVLDLFLGAPCRTYADILEAGVSEDVINWAVAHSHLFCDLSSYPIATRPVGLLLFRDMEILAGWMKADRPKPNFAAVEISELAPGHQFTLDGRPLRVSMVGHTTIFCTGEDQKYVELPIPQLMAAIQSGKATFPDFIDPSRGTRFWSANPSEIAKAIRRIGILERYEKGEVLPIQDRYSLSTFRRWKRLISEGKDIGLSPMEALIGQESKRGNRGAHVAPALDELLNKLILERLQRKEDESTITHFSAVKKEVEAHGHEMIAKSSFYDRVTKIRSVETLKSSHGHKVAYQSSPTHWMLDQDTPVHCERAFQLVHFDSTLLDIVLHSSISGDVLGRVWLSLAICAYSRRVLGMYLSFQSPSYISSMMLLADIVRRYGRLPDAIIHDWGSEFKGKDWQEALTALFIMRHVRPKSSPRFGAILERIFGTVTAEFVHNLAGNTKHTKEVRTLTPGSSPTVHSGLTMANLYFALEEYFFTIYDGRKHTTTFQLPRVMCDASLNNNVLMPHRTRTLTEILPIILPRAKGRPRVVDPARGVYVNGRYYGHPSLAELSRGGDVAIVRPNPFNPGRVLASIDGGWFECKSAIDREMLGLSSHARLALHEEWQIESRLVRDSRDKSRIQIYDLIEMMNQAALDNKTDWKMRAKEFPIADFGDLEEPAERIPAIDRLTGMMQKAIDNAMLGAENHPC